MRGKATPREHEPVCVLADAMAGEHGPEDAPSVAATLRV
jgi:hypothetical protein